MTSQHVLVTGGSGFIAGHCILRLLADGHRVRSTLRSPAREAEVRIALEHAGMTRGDQLRFIAADLLDDRGWPAAMDGIDHVLHVASPVRPGLVADEDAIVVPAREGTLRVLRAARDARVTRVVLTSAFHAVSWGLVRQERPFTEADWTKPDGPGVDAYGRSKTLAERAAWDFIAGEGGGLELTAMLPVAVIGPVLGRTVTGANDIVRRMLEGTMTALPNLFIPVVDVRDVAEAHVSAMTNPVAAGERFLLSNGRPLGLREIAAMLREGFGEDARRVTMRVLPDIVVRAGALFSPALRAIRHDLGYAKQTSNDKARRVLGWSPRPAEAAIEAAARSMIAGGLLR